ncbi:MAG: ATPase [Bryobacteraceae bacterium]|nr:ATPase [Bryobacteraceae bacterium]
MAEFFLGVDGGQSSTTALIGNEEGRVLGFGKGGPCNHVSGPDARERFMSAIGGCVRQALSEAGLADGQKFEGACFGFSGGAGDKQALLAEMFTIEHRIVTHDAMIALAGAHAGGPGLIVIAGTGSIAFGRNAEGKIARVGGWGYVYGDEGGGFDITRQALRAALRLEEGWGPPTVLREKLLAATGAANANDLMHRFYTPAWPRPKIAALSKLVDEAAAAGDAIARDILAVAAQQLAGIAVACRRLALGLDQDAAVAPIGGVFKSALLREDFVKRVQAIPGMTVREAIYNPAAGALLEAYRAAGRAVPALTGMPEQEKTYDPH